MADPTYVTEKISANPVWQLAFLLSEILNDNAPIGWGSYIYTAERVFELYNIKRRPPAGREKEGKP